jgi:hypothetical protein
MSVFAISASSAVAACKLKLNKNSTAPINRVCILHPIKHLQNFFVVYWKRISVPNALRSGGSFLHIPAA